MWRLCSLLLAAAFVVPAVAAQPIPGELRVQASLSQVVVDRPGAYPLELRVTGENVCHSDPGPARVSVDSRGFPDGAPRPWAVRPADLAINGSYGVPNRYAIDERRKIEILSDVLPEREIWVNLTWIGSSGTLGSCPPWSVEETSVVNLHVLAAQSVPTTFAGSSTPAWLPLLAFVVLLGVAAAATFLRRR